MTKFGKRLIIAFIIGIIIICIGCIISLFELSAISYAGTKPYESYSETTDETFTETLDQNVSTVEIDIDRNEWQKTIIPDNSVPQNKIIFEVKYPVDTYLNYWYNIEETFYEDDEDSEYSQRNQHNNEKTAYANFDLSGRNVFGELRLRIDDLKDKKIYDYVSQGTLTIKVHPDNVNKIVLD